jgi:hypothetical protein
LAAHDQDRFTEEFCGKTVLIMVNAVLASRKPIPAMTRLGASVAHKQ